MTSGVFICLYKRDTVKSCIPVQASFGCRQPIQSPSISKVLSSNRFLSQRRQRTRAGLVISNTLGTSPGKGLSWEVWVPRLCPTPVKWQLHKPLNICGVASRGAFSFTPALSFWVTNIHVLVSGLLSDSEVKINHLFLTPIPLSLALSSLDDSVN